MKLVLNGLENMLNSKQKIKPLTFIGLDLTRACNLRCVYCFSEAYKKEKNELTLLEKKDVLKQAKELGAKTLIVAGSGEPLLDSDFEEVITYAHRKGFIPVVYTNGTLIDKKMAKFLHDHNVSVLIKLESLEPEIHDSLTQVKGSHQKAVQAIKNLLKAGYRKITGNITRIGTTTLYLKQNLEEIPKIIQFCQKNNIKPTIDVMGIHGKAIKHEKELKPTKEQILEIQKKYFKEESLCQQSECILWKYGIVIDTTGNAKYCTEIQSKDIGNIRKIPLKKLIEIKREKYPSQPGTFTCKLKENFYTF